MDFQVGEYISLLEERDILDNTLVVFFSDNGAPFPRSKATLYDTGIKTPLIFSWNDRIEPGIEYDNLMSLIDLAPTILDIAGVDIPAYMSGKSVLNILKNPQLSGRTFVFSERNWHNCDEHMRSVRSSQYKFITNAYTDLPHGSCADVTMSPSWLSLLHLKQENKLNNAQSLLFTVPRPQEELYDIKNDPYELNNLIGQQAFSEIAAQLRAELETWRQETADFSPEMRRRKDNTDRYTGVKFDQTRLPPRIDN
jgi:arylsulfatase A-like enzyme